MSDVGIDQSINSENEGEILLEKQRKYFYEIPSSIARCIFSARRRVFVCHPEVEERRLVGLAHILRTKTIFTGEGVQTTL